MMNVVDIVWVNNDSILEMEMMFSQSVQGIFHGYRKNIGFSHFTYHCDGDFSRGMFGNSTGEVMLIL